MNATTSPAVPLFFAAGAGAFAGLIGDLPLSPYVALAVLAAIAAIATKERLSRALSLPLLALAVSAAAGAWQRDLGVMRASSLPSTLAVYEGVVDDVLFSATGHTRFVIDVDGALLPSAAAADADADAEAEAAAAAVDAAADAAADAAVGAAAPVPTALDATLGVVVQPGVATDVRPGDRVRVRGFARGFAPASSPGELDAAKLALARGLDARLSVSRPFDVAVMARAEEARVFANARIALRDRLSTLLPPRLAGLELALLVGDTSFLDEEQRDIYRRVGAGHLLAVSGLQVSLIALLLERFALLVLMMTPLGRRGRGRALATAAALAGVWAFVLLCGAPPSAVRAGAMASAVLFAALVGRRARAFDAIGIAGLVTVLASPASVLDPSFLLSYGAVLGLAATTVRDDQIADDTSASPSRVSLLRAMATVIIASVGAGVVTMPLSAWLFGEIAPAGLIANIVLVPLATVVQVPALALGLLGALLNTGWIAWLGAQAALFLEAVAAGLGDLLPAVRPVPATSGLSATLLVAVALWFAAALARKRRKQMIVTFAAAAVVLYAASREPSGIRIAVLPVGQGDGAVIEMPDGTVMVVDAGGTHDGRFDPGRDVVVPFLKRRGIDEVDVMVASHPHPDHVGGLPSVARAFPVRAFWHNGAHVGPLMQRALDALARDADVDVNVKTTPALLGTHRFGDATVEVLAPAPAEGTPTYPELDANDNSLVLRICLGTTCALWGGDIETLGEGLLLERHGPEALRADVVKAPHHGSRSSSTAPFVAATGAKHVIFCTGRDNGFGFPHEEVVARWQAASARLWDTARHGEITIFLTGEAVDVHGFTD